MKTSKSNSKISTANGASSTTPKKSNGPKRMPAKKTTRAHGARSVLAGAAPYALPGAGVLAAAALAATGFVLRKNIASFASEKAESGVEEVLRMLHLERRSSTHLLGALGVFAGGLALGCIAGFFLVVPRLARMAKEDEGMPTADTRSSRDGVSHERPQNNSVISHSS